MTKWSWFFVCFAAACSKDEYGFVARLGDDTTSVEHVTRTGNRIVSDVVEKSPRVIRKHWEAEVDENGRLVSWTMDKAIAHPQPGEPGETHYTAEFGGDSVLVTEDNGTETRRYVMKELLPVTVPWESYVYGLYELLFEAAVKQASDSVPVKQYMPGMGLGRGVVRRQGTDSLTFVTGGLAGTGVARLDERGRMLTYSGKHTTFKHEVERVDDAPDIDGIARRFIKNENEAPPRSLSTRDTTRAQVGAADITIDYSRPLRRGRDILGNIVPYGSVWRTGANAATQLQTSAPLSIGGINLAPGIYTLWTLPAQDGVQLIVNRQSGQWGTRYNPKQDLARTPMQTETLNTPVDTFTIRIESAGATAALVMEWDRFRWRAPIAVK